MRPTIPLILILLMAAPAQAYEPPEYEAVYEVHRGNIGGESVMRLEHAEDGWTFHSRLRTTGLASLLLRVDIEETSAFTIERERVVPLRHLYRFHGGRRDRDFTLDFDWVERRVHGIVRGEPGEAPLDAGAVDRHAMVIALMLDLSHERGFPKAYTVIDRARVRHFDVTLDGEERVETGDGTYSSIRIVQQRKDDETRRFVSWHAPELGYIPVRIESQDDDGRDVTMTLKELSLAETRRRRGKEDKD